MLRALLLALILTLVAACENSRPAPTDPGAKPNLDLPIRLTTEGWAALEGADPEGASQVDAVNAAWLCGFERDSLDPDDAEVLCDD